MGTPEDTDLFVKHGGKLEWILWGPYLRLLEGISIYYDVHWLLYQAAALLKTKVPHPLQMSCTLQVFNFKQLTFGRMLSVAQSVLKIGFALAKKAG